jgi:hypothetical protein
MQAWLQPVQSSISLSRPLATLFASSGSATIARVIPIASASPRATIRSATSGSVIRVVAITGRPTASRTLPASAAIVSWLTGAGGAIQVDPR